MTYKRVYRFCDGEIVDGLNRRRYNPKKDDDMQCICTIINALINQANEYYEEKESLKVELDTHKHPLGSTREAERKVNELISFKNKVFTILDEETKETEKYNHVDTSTYYARKQLLQDLKRRLKQ